MTSTLSLIAKPNVSLQFCGLYSSMDSVNSGKLADPHKPSSI